MEPTAAEVEDLGLAKCVKAIGTWAGWEEVDIGHFFDLMGFETMNTVHPRVLCSLPEAEFQQALDSWCINDIKVKPNFRMTALLIFKTCKFVLGVPPSAPLAPVDTQGLLNEAMQQFKTHGGPGAELRKIKASNVIDPADESVVLAATSNQLKTWYLNYKAIKYGDPLPEKEPTPDQISAMHTKIIVLHLEPYADFSLLTPHGRRMAKELRHRSWLPQEDGTFKPIEVPGPESFDVWKSCWDVYEVIMLMLRWPAKEVDQFLTFGDTSDSALSTLVATPIALEAYLQNFSTLVKENPGCWHLCQRAEDRCRAEHFPRLWRRIEETSGCTPTWSAVLFAAAEDDKYWDKEVRRPALRFLATRNSPAPIQGPAAFETVKKSADTEVGNGKKNKKSRNNKRNRSVSAGRAQPAAKARAGDQRQHPIKDSQGRFTTTREGTEICFKFSNGDRSACPEPCPQKRAHVCQKCLQPHRASTCTKKS